jgi:hypothetical protein
MCSDQGVFIESLWGWVADKPLDEAQLPEQEDQQRKENDYDHESCGRQVHMEGLWLHKWFTVYSYSAWQFSVDDWLATDVANHLAWYLDCGLDVNLLEDWRT